MDGIFGDLFDMNGDGKLDSIEHAVDFMVFEEMVKETEAENDSDEFIENEDGDEESDY